jgi:hypothetical protein
MIAEAQIRAAIAGVLEGLADAGTVSTDQAFWDTPESSAQGFYASGAIKGWLVNFDGTEPPDRASVDGYVETYLYTLFRFRSFKSDPSSFDTLMADLALAEAAFDGLRSLGVTGCEHYGLEVSDARRREQFSDLWSHAAECRLEVTYDHGC